MFSVGLLKTAQDSFTINLESTVWQSCLLLDHWVHLLLDLFLSHYSMRSISSAFLFSKMLSFLRPCWSNLLAEYSFPFCLSFLSPSPADTWAQTVPGCASPRVCLVRPGAFRIQRPVMPLQRGQPEMSPDVTQGPPVTQWPLSPTENCFSGDEVMHEILTYVMCPILK